MKDGRCSGAATASICQTFELQPFLTSCAQHDSFPRRGHEPNQSLHARCQRKSEYHQGSYSQAGALQSDWRVEHRPVPEITGGAEPCGFSGRAAAGGVPLLTYPESYLIHRELAAPANSTPFFSFSYANPVQSHVRTPRSCLQTGRARWLRRLDFHSRQIQMTIRQKQKGRAKIPASTRQRKRRHAAALQKGRLSVVGGVLIGEGFQIFGEVVDGVNGVVIAGRNAGAAVGTLVGIDEELRHFRELGFVLARVDAIDRASFDAVLVLRASISDNERHLKKPSPSPIGAWTHSGRKQSQGQPLRKRSC